MAIPEVSAERRRRLTHRALPALAALAFLSAGAGMVVGAGQASVEQRTALEFTRAWERQDYRAMYAKLDAASRRAYSFAEFRTAYRDTAATATLDAIDADDPARRHDGLVTVPIRMHTRVFGRIRADLRSEEH